MEGPPRDEAHSRASAWTSLAFDRAASTATVRWFWSNPGDRSHPLPHRDEVWHIAGAHFVIDDGGEWPAGTSYTGELVAGAPWHWTQWRTEVVASPIHGTMTYERRDGHLRSEGHKVTGAPGEHYTVTEDQHDDLVEVTCDAWDQEVRALAEQLLDRHD
jgi:hypothetical protein